jgi:hypothetical protein
LTSLTRIVLMVALLLAVTVLSTVGPRPKYAPPLMASAEAATPNISVGGGQVMVFPFHISGQYTATTASVARFAMPQPCDLIGVGASARASGGTSPTLTVDVKSGGSTVLSAPISVTAGSYTEGTITTTAIADEAAITFDFTITGTSPTWNDMTVLLTCSRK